MVRIGRSRNRNIPGLYLPAQDDLRRGLSVCLGDLHDRFVSEMVLRMSPAAERIPGFDHDAIRFYIFLQFIILIIQMIFILNDGRCDLRIGEHLIHLFRGVVVGNTDGAHDSLFHSLFQAR